MLENPSEALSQRKKILFFVSDYVYVRNYLSNDALSSLQANHSVYFAVSSKVPLDSTGIDSSRFAGHFSYSESVTRTHHLLFQALAWNFRKKSRTFFYRLLRQSNWDQVLRNGPMWERVKSVARWVRGLFSRSSPLLGIILGSRIIFPFAGKFLRSALQINSEVLFLLSSQNWDVAIFPSTGFDPLAMDVARAGQELSIPTIGLIDNWDNLISKSIFWAKPDFLGVWGDQAVEQAVGVQGFSKHQVVKIGTPRFDHYFQHRNAVGRTGNDYLLFVGSAMPFDEISALHRIEESLRKLGYSPKDTMVLYRPHPWQQKRLVPAYFDEKKFEFTKIDPQLEERQLQKPQKMSEDTSFQPDLEYYPELFGNSRMVIGPLTTMLFEAALCLRPVLALTYPDGHHFNTTVRYFTHFEGMDSVPGFEFCHDETHLTSQISSALESDPISQEESDKVLSRYLHFSSLRYPDRLLELTNDVIATRGKEN